MAAWNEVYCLGVTQAARRPLDARAMCSFNSSRLCLDASDGLAFDPIKAKLTNSVTTINTRPVTIPQ